MRFVSSSRGRGHGRIGRPADRWPTARRVANPTRALLACGVAGGSLFMIVALAQAFTRPGFDLRRHPLSLLLLGDLGWIQELNFVGCGLIILALAVGARRVLRSGLAGNWGPLLLAGFGMGLIIAGIFHPDASLGFPPGAPAGTPRTMSWHSSLHGVAFALSFISVTAACFVFARRFAALGARRWSVYSLFTGIMTPLLIVVGIVVFAAVGIAFAIAGALASWWLAALALQLSVESIQTTSVSGSTRDQAETIIHAQSNI